MRSLLRTTRSVVAAAAVATMLAACGGSTESPGVPAVSNGVPTADEINGTIDTAEVKKSLVVGVDNSHYIFHVDLVVAKVKGYFAEFGIDDVEIKTVDNPVPGLIGGSLDFANADSDAVIASADKANTDLRLLGITFGGEWSILGVGPGITNADELRGATLSPGQFRTRHDNNLRNLLRTNGLDPDTDVTIVETGGAPNERVQAIIAGTIDGGTVQLRHRSMLEAAGGRFLFEDFQQVPQSGWAADRILADSPETAPAFLAAVLKARQFVTNPANKDEVLQIMADNGFDIPQDYQDAYADENAPDYHTVDGGFEVGDMNDFVDVAKDLGVVPADANWQQWVDLIPLWRAQKAVGDPLRPAPADFSAAQ